MVVAKWIKGEPLTGFEKGKVYVVDFWATWCGPCKAAIPHLTKLQQKHKGAVEIIGVSISERQKDSSDTSYIEGVEKFVEKQAEKMDYRVAVDTPTKTMHTTWFKPTGTGGIPTAYIIDKQGLVAWTGIGSPPVIERIVEEIIAGTFDARKEVERQAKQDEEEKRNAAKSAAAAQQASAGRNEKYPGYDDAMKKGDLATANACLEAAFAKDPTLEAQGAYQWKLMNLMQSMKGKPDAVNAYAKELCDRYEKKNDDVVSFVSAVLVQTDEETPRFDNAIALRAAAVSEASAKKDSRWSAFAKWRLGWAKWHIGDKAGAKVAMADALETAKRLKTKFDLDSLVDQCEDALKTMNK